MTSVGSALGGMEIPIQLVDPCVAGNDQPLTQIERLHAIAQEAIVDRRGVVVFVGPSFTERTTAAKAIARDMGSNLIRVKLVDIFSEILGATEANLEAVFHAATNVGAVILFDEADALFGTRSDTKNSLNTLAPISADLLMRRIESYPGLVILGCFMLPPPHWKNKSHVVHFGREAQFSYEWRAVEQGVPLSALDEFAAYSGIPIKDLLEVVIPARTLKHRRQRSEPLNLDESDRLARVSRTFELAVKVYKDRDDGRDWLMSTMRRFDGRTALSMLRTEAGEHAVREFLIQIDEGMFI
jgi:putative toxin-antitoxin system antitoxin component (TIGR02293 family)